MGMTRHHHPIANSALICTQIIFYCGTQGTDYIDFGYAGGDNLEPRSQCSHVSQNPQDVCTTLGILTLIECISDNECTWVRVASAEFQAYRDHHSNGHKQAVTLLLSEVWSDTFSSFSSCHAGSFFTPPVNGWCKCLRHIQAAGKTERTKLDLQEVGSAINKDMYLHVNLPCAWPVKSSTGLRTQFGSTNYNLPL